MLNLIVVAHPDDEILGYGGTGYLETLKGNEIQPLILCGQVDARNKRPKDLELIQDIKKANSLLGFNEPILGDFPNLKMNTFPHIDIVRFIEENIQNFSPDNIFTHHPNDLNDDHRQVSKACLAASRLSQRNNKIKPIKGLYFMEILSSTEWAINITGNLFNPNIFVEINKSIDLKILALSCYRDVMRKSPHPRSENVLRAHSTFRGAQIGFEYAEAFELAFKRGINE